MTEFQLLVPFKHLVVCVLLGPGSRELLQAMGLFECIPTASLADVRAKIATLSEKQLRERNGQGQTLLFAAASRPQALGGAFTAVKALLDAGALVHRGAEGRWH